MGHGTRKKSQEKSGVASDCDTSGDFKLPCVNNNSLFKKITAAEQPSSCTDSD